MEDIPGKFWCRYYICKTLIETSKITMTLSHFNSIPFFSANNIHETHHLIRDHTGGTFCYIVPFRLYLQWNVPVFKFLDHHGHYNNPQGVWFLLPVILIFIRITKLAFWATFTDFTLRTESPSIFLDKLGRGRNLCFLFPDLSRKDQSDSASRVTDFGPVDERENSLMAEFNQETDLNLS